MKSKSPRQKKRANADRSICVSQDYCYKVLGALASDLKGYLSVDDFAVISAIIRKRDFEQVLNLADFWGLQSMVSEHNFAHLPKWKARYAIASLLKKYLFDPTDTLVQDQVAYDSFFESEKSCRFFNSFGIKKVLNGEKPEDVEFLTYARSFLKKLLDKLPVKEIIQNARHGPGTSLDTLDGQIDSFSKFSTYPYSCTKECIGYAIFMIETDKRWKRALTEEYMRVKNLTHSNQINQLEFYEHFIKVVDHNRVSSVPKNAKTSRSIAIEPTLNLMLQLGVDRFVKKRLKRFGVRLDSQELNRSLARTGSISGLFSTIDLKAASDRISLSICEALLPEEWYLFLLAIRSPRGLIGSTSLTYEKMSSMGNGFTFALESAIFAAITFAAYRIKGRKAVFGDNAAVFGDDIIVSSDIALDVVKYLKHCGFTTNTDKSFFTGPIRESCGTDWFKGRPLRPIFLSRPPSNVMELYNDLNRLKRYLELSFGITNSNCEKTILKWIPPELRFYGPYSDEVFDSWIHSKTRSTNIDRNHSFVFKRCLYQRVIKKVDKSEGYGRWYFFLLCHDLKEKTPFDKFSLNKRVKSEKGGGSRFVRYIRNNYRIITNSTAVSVWTADYHNLLM